MGDYYGIPTGELSSPYLQLDYLAERAQRPGILAIDSQRRVEFVLGVAHGAGRAQRRATDGVQRIAGGEQAKAYGAWELPVQHQEIHYPARRNAAMTLAIHLERRGGA